MRGWVGEGVDHVEGTTGSLNVFPALTFQESLVSNICRNALSLYVPIVSVVNTGVLTLTIDASAL